jgi:hypothetical protein
MNPPGLFRLGKKFARNPTINVSTKTKLIVLGAFVVLPLTAYLVVYAVVQFMPERVSVSDACKKQCLALNRGYRLDGKGPLTTKNRYLEYECVCL